MSTPRTSTVAHRCTSPQYEATRSPPRNCSAVTGSTLRWERASGAKSGRRPDLKQGLLRKPGNGTLMEILLRKSWNMPFKAISGSAQVIGSYHGFAVFRFFSAQAVDKQQMTALHLAASHDEVEVCRMLIERGANLRCCDEEMGTPLHFACMEGSVKVVKMLFEAAEKLDGWVTISQVRILSNPSPNNNERTRGISLCYICHMCHGSPFCWTVFLLQHGG